MLSALTQLTKLSLRVTKVRALQHHLRTNHQAHSQASQTVVHANMYVGSTLHCLCYLQATTAGALSPGHHIQLDHPDDAAFAAQYTVSHCPGECNVFAIVLFEHV